MLIDVLGKSDTAKVLLGCRNYGKNLLFGLSKSSERSYKEDLTKFGIRVLLGVRKR